MSVLKIVVVSVVVKYAVDVVVKLGAVNRPNAKPAKSIRRIKITATTVFTGKASCRAFKKVAMFYPTEQLSNIHRSPHQTISPK
ncbi:MAG: hypothetical protein NZ570_02015 [Candidatus Caldarchaeum sp.]|nr:hypothetical protein [Candidatus Caldarchaeum sp.]MDW8359474.1 hypothetical protein [Candidatus Caldarchaeum sp.]